VVKYWYTAGPEPAAQPPWF